MKLVPVLVVYTLALGAFAQAPRTAPWPPILDQLCGRLQHAPDAVLRGTAFAFDVKSVWNLPHVVVKLYPAVENAQCCKDAMASANGITDRWGSFNLKTKRLQEGLYWLEVRPDGQSHALLVRYVPSRTSDQRCYENVWNIDDGGQFTLSVRKLMPEN